MPTRESRNSPPSSVEDSSSQQIRIQTLEFPGTRSAQGKAVFISMIGDQGMNFIKKLRQFLDLINHNPGALSQCLDFKAQFFWVPQQLQKLIRAEQVKPFGSFEDRFEPGCFSRPPGTKKKKGMAGSLENSCLHCAHFNGSFARCLFFFFELNGAGRRHDL
jgi:hypothetical protein